MGQHSLRLLNCSHAVGSSREGGGNGPYGGWYTGWIQSRAEKISGERTAPLLMLLFAFPASFSCLESFSSSLLSTLKLSYPPDIHSSHQITLRPVFNLRCNFLSLFWLPFCLPHSFSPSGLPLNKTKVKDYCAKHRGENIGEQGRLKLKVEAAKAKKPNSYFGRLRRREVEEMSSSDQTGCQKGMGKMNMRNEAELRVNFCFCWKEKILLPQLWWRAVMKRPVATATGLRHSVISSNYCLLTIITTSFTTIIGAGWRCARGRTRLPVICVCNLIFWVLFCRLFLSEYSPTLKLWEIILLGSKQSE